MRRASDDPELASRFRAARVLFFDCDGVLFDSNGFKLDALRAVMADYPAGTHQPMLDYWREFGGVSRYVKFRHYLEVIVGISDPGELERHHARCVAGFAQRSRAAYGRHDPLPEALTLLGAAGSGRSHVISGSDQDELRQVFADKGLDRLVASVCGSPTTKAEHVTRILEATGAAPAQALFFGDGGGDFAACRETGVELVYLAQLSEWKGAAEALAGAPGVIYARDYAELLPALGL